MSTDKSSATKTKNNRSSFLELWNLLKSMKFAIVILVILAAASIFNLFAVEFIVPANGSSEQISAIYHQEYGSGRAAALMFFQMNSPYHSWWFTVLLVLLTLSLTICVVDRAETMLKRAFKPAFVSDLSRFVDSPNFKKLKKLDPSHLENTLRKKGYVLKRESLEDGSIVINGNRFSFAASGAWFVHIGFIFLVIGGAMIARGEYRERVGGYPGDLLARGASVNWGFDVRVDDFDVEYYDLMEGQLVMVNNTILGRLDKEYPDGAFDVESYRPSRGMMTHVEAEKITNGFDMRSGGGRLDQSNISDYIATLTVIEDGKDIFTSRVEVNAPLRHKGFRFYQSSFIDRPNAAGKWQTVLEARRDNGSPFIWVGIIIVTLGLVAGLYFVPRQIFAVIRDGEIQIAGKADRNRTIFEKDFQSFISELEG